MRAKVLIALTVMLLLVACDTSPTPTQTPLPTQTATVTPLPATPTPLPTFTPQPTAMPTAQPTFCPIAAVVVHCCVDEDDSGDCQDGELPVYCTVLLGYNVGVQTPIYTEVVAGAGGVGVAIITPGMYTVLLYRFDAAIPVAPDYRQTVAFVVNAGNDFYLHVPFVSRVPLPTPTVTRTPTPAPYQCPAYATNCLPSCSGNLVVDPLGQCQPPLLCCKPMPTRTVVTP